MYMDTDLSDAVSLRSQVFHKIEKMILDGEFSQGDNLTESKLCSILGVSRTPVREALNKLELEGLVKNIPNRGAVVIGISQKDINDIYEIRIYIEGKASRFCAENISQENLEKLNEIVSLQEFYVQRGDDNKVWQLDSSFHTLIYESCNNRPLQYMLSSFHNYIQKARAVSFKIPGRAEASVREHRNIYDAIAKKDGDLAEKYTAIHISNARDNMHQNVKE